MKYIILIIALALSGCVTTASRDIAEPVIFTLSREVSWKWKPPLGYEQTIIFEPGTYLATRRDTEGYYLVAPNKKYKVLIKDKTTIEQSGGLYLPDDQSKGPATFIYDQGFTTAVNGMIIAKPPSDKMRRIGSWGPSSLISEFKRQ